MYTSCNLLESSELNKNNKQKFKYFAITPELESLCEEYISETAKNISLVIDMFWFPQFCSETIDNKTVKLALKNSLDKIDKSILSVFDMFDKGNIEDGVLLNYLGICSILFRINKFLKENTTCVIPK